MLPFVRMFDYGNEVQPLPGIKKIVARGIYCMVLLDSGDLYIRGQNLGSTFGNGSASNTIYTGDWVLSTTGIKNIWSNSGTTICTTFDNRVLSSGSIRGLTGSTASSTTTFTDRTTTFINAGLNPEQIVDVALNGYDIFALASSGEVYSGGINYSGQHGSTGARAFQLNTVYTNAKKISLSPDQTGTFWYLDTSNDFYGCGNGSVGQILGTKTVSSKKLISSDVIDFTANINCFFISKSDGLYCAGSQFNGQLGNGVKSNNIGEVGRTTLYKLPNFSTAPSYIFNDTYLTVVLYENKWYCTGSTGKSGAGINNNSSSFIVNNTIIPDNSNPRYAINNDNSYVVSNSGLLYGTGIYSSSTDLLPGYSTSQYEYVLLSTKGMNN